MLENRGRNSQDRPPSDVNHARNSVLASAFKDGAITTSGKDAIQTPPPLLKLRSDRSVLAKAGAKGANTKKRGGQSSVQLTTFAILSHSPIGPDGTEIMLTVVATMLPGVTRRGRNVPICQRRNGQPTES